MTRPAGVALALCTALVASAPAQLQARKPEPIPPEVLLETIRAAYDKRPTADEIKVTLLKGPPGGHLPTDTLASDTLIVRMDPGPPGARTPSRLLLDFGSLRVLVAAGEMTAINPAVPGRYYQVSLGGPLTPQSLSRALPPTPVPEIALACADPVALGELTPYTPRVAWTSATLDASAHSGVLVGTSAAGPIVLTANAATGRLTKIVATIKGPAGENTLELSVSPIDAGSPTTWTIPLDGRARVASLAELRSPASNGPVAVGQPVPDLTPQQMDASAWSLHRFLAQPPATPLAYILYRAAPDRIDAASRDARAAAAVVRAVQLGQTSPGESAAGPVDVKLAAALVMELGQFNRAVFDQEQRLWQAGAPSRHPEATPAWPPPLLWANAASQSIDRFDAKAGAVLLVVAPDRTLLKIVLLDGRAADPALLASDVRAALASTAPR